jgi:hypothetical protein
MIATYLTLLIVSSASSDTTYASIPYETREQCEFAMVINADVWRENGMMSQCYVTHLVTSSSPPVPRPEGLTDE